MIQLIIKELKEFGYGFYGIGSMLLFLALTFAFLWVFPQSSYISYGFSDPQNYFSFISYLFLFIVPLIAVGMVTREYALGTFELLKTQGVSWTSIIGAKFIATMIYLILIIVLTLIHLYVLDALAVGGGIIGVGQLIGSLIGVVLIAAVYTSVALFIASYVEHGTLAIIITILICFLLYAGIYFLADLEMMEGGMDYTLKTYSLQWHADQLSKGVMTLSTITYLLSICAVGIIGSVFILQRKSF